MKLCARTTNQTHPSWPGSYSSTVKVTPTPVRSSFANPTARLMAAASVSGPVMVEQAASAPVVDLAKGSGPVSATHTNGGAKAMATATVQVPKEDLDDDDDNDDDDGDDGNSSVGLSLYEEMLDDAEARDYIVNGDGDACTPEESRTLKQRLHDVGASQFVLETITKGNFTARKLCTAFGVRIPAYMDQLPDEGFYKLLGLAISREASKRLRLPQYKTVDDAARLLRESTNIMVITGAGISTSLGIPDFRSKNTGFYSQLLEMGFHEPEQVFDIHNFDDDPSVFYKLAGDILPDLKKWTPTHEFIRLLQDKNKLLTNYTQNIDNVEAHAGIRKDRLIQCHGSWATATCRKCKYHMPGEAIFEDVRRKKPKECPRCVEEIANQKPGMKRKRSSNGSKKRRGPGNNDSDSDGAYDIPQPGIMKPDITFFGEALPDNFFDRLKEVDKDKVDLVIVMGTSMKVAPVSEIPNFLPQHVPQIYISRDVRSHCPVARLLLTMF
jgi:NAD-dependent histone deacetylase SIR2